MYLLARHPFSQPESFFKDKLVTPTSKNLSNKQQPKFSCLLLPQNLVRFPLGRGKVEPDVILVLMEFLLRVKEQSGLSFRQKETKVCHLSSNCQSRPPKQQIYLSKIWTFQSKRITNASSVRSSHLQHEHRFITTILNFEHK